jgi:hypothetical protein
MTDQDPSCTPSVLAEQVIIFKNIIHLYLQWLGVLFDKKLSFKYYVKNLALKVLTTTNALHSLGNTVQGVNPYLI